MCILNKIKFHYTYLLISLLFILTGSFLNLIVFSILIFIHEFGHVYFIKKYNLKIKKIIIYPYGGLIKYDDFLNLDIKKDFFISIFGIISQSLFFLLVFYLYKNNIIRFYTYNLFYLYHHSMVIFNILPIYPLDGSKILSCLLYKIFNYKLSIKLNIIISIIALIISCYIYCNNYTYIMILFILIDNIRNYYYNSDYLYNRFLLERYLYKFNFKNLKIVRSKNKLYKNSRHIIKYNDKYIKEEKILKKIFDKNSNLW